MKQIIYLISLIFIIFPVFSQEKITEKVEVDWWILPLFAVDQKGNSITDLEKSDIKIFVNNREIQEFTFLKRAYLESRPATLKPSSTSQAVLYRKKMIFLIFDLTISNPGTVEDSKSIAKKIIQKAEKNHWFIIMTIEPFSGLSYLFGPSRQKSILLDIINKQVIRKPQSKTFSIKTEMEEMLAIYPPGKYTEKELVRFFLPLRAKSYLNKAQSFFKSFELLYYNINSLKDHKFVYLFTDGITRDVMEVGGRDMVRKQLQHMVSFLNRSGTMLFLINSCRLDDTEYVHGAGHDSLTFLAQESGGKYIKGYKKTILRQLEKIHKAYYEIAFTKPSHLKDNIQQISIKPNRKGIKIHTIKTMEKERTYAQMTDIEKEVLVLNLISGNQLARTFMKAHPVNPEKTDTGKKKLVYYLTLPDSFLNKKIDCYKVWINESTGDTKIKKESIIPENKEVKISFETKERTKNYFVLVNGEVNTVLVKGMIYHKPGPVSLAKKQPDSTFEIPSIKKIEKPIQKKKRKTSEIKIEDESLKQQELKKLLNGAAVYCDKLKKAAFHYICKEKVVETIDKRGSGQNSLSPENAAAFSDPQWRLYYANQISVQNISNQNKKEIYKYLFDYQMIKDKGKISEQRKYLKGKNEKLGKAIADYRIRSFLAQKAIFAPATLLDKNRQYKYHFNFIGYKKQKKHTFAIIEARPKNPEDAHYIYGKIWIDINDYSIKKILVNPGAIRGYEKLLEFSKKLQTRLFLDCEIDFDETYQGMRFPSRIVLSEKYKGGPVFRREWERCKTVYKYQDYQFFKVQTEEIIK